MVKISINSVVIISYPYGKIKLDCFITPHKKQIPDGLKIKWFFKRTSGRIFYSLRVGKMSLKTNKHVYKQKENPFVCVK